MNQFSDLATRITKTIREQQLFSSGDTLIIGLSGGADSTALLDLLADLPGTPVRLIAAHLNHCLRGAESDADEKFCQELAACYKIPFELRRVDVKALAEIHNLNLEDAGRRARNAFFDELLTTRQAQAIALAHHADDQSETVLMRLLRGTGMTGLAGMSSRNDRNTVRPLLGVTRAEIIAHLTKRGLSWREDSSNLDKTFLRNRIRYELLPLLEQYNPSIRKNLVTTAAILSAENRLLDDLAFQTAQKICKNTVNSVSCTIVDLSANPQALQRRIIRQMLSIRAGNLEQFTHLHIENILQLTTSLRPNAHLNLPQGIIVLKEYDMLTFRNSAGPDQTALEIPIPRPGVYHLHDGIDLTVEPIPKPVDCSNTSPDSAFFDLHKVPFPWYVRTVRPGDRIQQLGMDGRKKVKDIFIDNKTPLSLRHRVPLIFCNNELIWVSGLRTSNQAKVDELSTCIVKARICFPSEQIFNQF